MAKPSTSIFLSYSHLNFHAAALVRKILEEEQIETWHDSNSLKAGDEWRSSIDDGIDTADVFVLILSEASMLSAYVTYEWARALTQGTTVIPVRIDACKAHPKLEPIQYFDFQTPSDSDYEKLVARVKDSVENSEETAQDKVIEQRHSSDAEVEDHDFEEIKKQIIEYMNARGRRSISFHLLRAKLGLKTTDARFSEMVEKERIFTHKTLHSRVNPKTRKGLRLR
ncbi:toll/interleukin-1 receptor domain-containing protein [Sulfitobacter sp.]|uniref:toll/interleukin-1 receptor domain-containing protein n=1 Tax=Sulfitobacter sp. TaxID=1903071 RepID=UPI003003361A